MARQRKDENKRESWLVKNTSGRTISIGDLPLVPTFAPNESHDLLRFYSREKVSHSTDLVSLIGTGWISLKKKRKNKTAKVVTTEDAAEQAITPAEEDDIGASNLTDLLDVDASSPSDNDHLVYDLATGLWGAEAVAAGVWTDSGSLLHPTASAGVYDVAIGGTDSTANIFLDASEGDITIQGALNLDADNLKATFGALQDASITYDGTNLVINPREVGTGDVSVSGADLSINPSKYLKATSANRIRMGDGGANDARWDHSGKLTFQQTGDISSGNQVTINSNAASELTDTDAEQAAIAINPEIAQTGTANYVGILLNVTETSTGSGQDYLMDLRVGGVSMFSVESDGTVAYGGGLVVTNSIDPVATFTSTNDAVSNQAIVINGNERATALDNDEAYISLMLDDDAGTPTEYARMTWVATDITDTEEDGAIAFSTVVAGTRAERIRLDGVNLQFADDNQKLLFGALQDASITYDGTDLVINPQEVGTGGVVVLVSSSANFEISGASTSTGLRVDSENGEYIEMGGRFFLFSSSNMAMRAPLFNFHITSNNLTAGNAFNFGTNGSLPGLGDTDAEQAWMKLEPNIEQTGTANYVGILLDVDEVSIGSGQDYLMDLRVGGVSMFSVESDGDVKIPTDNAKLLLGALQDASITYDGTNLVIDSQEVDSGDLIVNSGGGNVGIGTTTPTNLLHVNGGHARASGGFISGTDNEGITIGGAALNTTFKAADEGVADLAQYVGLRSSGVNFGGAVILGRSQGTIAAKTVVADGDVLGQIAAVGHDGTDFEQSTLINSEVDGTPSAGVMPGRIVFKTSPVGSALPAERMRIDSAGNMTVTGNINPEADGTRNLGTQTTAQWANVWSDLINGADFAMLNGWRILESDKYKNYPIGFAIGCTHFRDGVVTKTMPEEARPVFAVTEDFIEYKGKRITFAMFEKLIELLLD